jgi:hypothetical protein
MANLIHDFLSQAASCSLDVAAFVLFLIGLHRIVREALREGPAGQSTQAPASSIGKEPEARKKHGCRRPH